MKNRAVHQTRELDPSVVEKILARHEGNLSAPVVYKLGDSLESKGSVAQPPPYVGVKNTHLRDMRRFVVHRCWL